MTKDEIVEGLLAELAALSATIRPLNQREWSGRTRWKDRTVAEVAAHVVGTIADIAAGRVENQGAASVISRQIDERRGREPATLADELDGAMSSATEILRVFPTSAWERPAPGGFPGSLRQAVHAMWYDAFLHAEDIRLILGRSRSDASGLLASLRFVAERLGERGWGPAVLALDGTGEFPIGRGGPRITGDPLAFLLAAKGRITPESLGLDASVNVNWARGED
jgi:uncharacterized protein (TIGR03083 family)